MIEKTGFCMLESFKMKEIIQNDTIGPLMKKKKKIQRQRVKAMNAMLNENQQEDHK